MKLMHKRNLNFNGNAKSLRIKVEIIICLLIYSIIFYGYIETYLIEITEMKLKYLDLPGSFKNTKIVFVSDIHMGKFLSAKRVEKLVNKINKLNPDIIVLGGDYVDETKYIEPCFEVLKDLKARFGIYGVLGNHDNWEGKSFTIESMKKSNIKIIDNSSFWIQKGKESIKIGGVGDFWSDVQNINPIIKDVDNKDFLILVSHNPEYADRLTTSKVDFMLGGHTHGGQAAFLEWIGMTPKYVSGFYKTVKTNLLVTNGIGTYGVPLRLMARPQINVVIFE